MRNYSDLLPSYLDGENIRRHSGVIERSDKYLDGLVELFSLWNKLERPILIKREQLEGDGVNTVTIYVNTPTPITEIQIEGDIEETITPTDTVTTSYEGTWTIGEPSIHVGRSNIYLPEVLVTVRTETHTYKKAYPENDTIENNDADHDIFLDIIGGILGIPRRQYSAWTSGISEPPWFAKQTKIQTNNQLIFLECTEDDYYYKERLEYFITSTGNLRLFKAIYDKDAVLLNPEDFWIMDVDSPANVIFTHINKGQNVPLINKVNIDTTNIQEIAEQSLPVTRQTLILPYTTLHRYASQIGSTVNFLRIRFTVGLEQKTIDSSFSKEVPLTNLPIKITYSDGTEVGTWTTNEGGTAHIIIKGARAGQQTLQWNITKEYPYFEVTDNQSINYTASLFKLSLSDGAWQYKIANGTGVTNFEDPTILSNNNLNCGTGYMTYTPAINPALVDLSDYSLTVTFHYTNTAQRILLGTLEILEGDVAKITGLNVQPRAYASSNPSITDTHTLKFKFTDGVCSVYYDGNSTGVSKDFTGTEEMLYIAGYNSRASGSTQGLHIEEISVGEDTRVITELSCTTLNSTTGSASVKATLTANGSGVSGATIQCKNGSTTLTSGTTSSNGECTLDLSTLQAGSYTLTIQYDGDTTHQATSTTHTINITDPTPVTLNLYGKGQSTGWSTTQWTTIEINAAAEAHCNYTKRNAILKQLPLSGDFTLVLHIQASHNTSWNWGLIPSQSDYSNPAMKVSKGDTLNGSTSIATMFDHGSGVWDTTVPVTVTRSGTNYTLEYNGNSYSFTGSTDTLYLWMDKTGSGNLFLTYIETTATMQ